MACAQIRPPILVGRVYAGSAGNAYDGVSVCNGLRERARRRKGDQPQGQARRAQQDEDLHQQPAIRPGERGHFAQAGGEGITHATER